MEPLSEKQREVLEFIRRCVKENGVFPNATAVAVHMGWKNETSASDCLSRLAAKGYLRVARRIPSRRGWRTIYELREAV